MDKIDIEQQVRVEVIQRDCSRINTAKITNPEMDKQLELQVSSSLRWQAFTARLQLQKNNSRAKKLGSGSKIENQSQKARLWLQNKTNQSQKLGSGSRIFLRLDHQ